MKGLNMKLVLVFGGLLALAACGGIPFVPLV